MAVLNGQMPGYFPVENTPRMDLARGLNYDFPEGLRSLLFSEGGQIVQTSSYKINKSRGYRVKHSDQSQQYCIVLS